MFPLKLHTAPLNLIVWLHIGWIDWLDVIYCVFFILHFYFGLLDAVSARLPSDGNIPGKTLNKCDFCLLFLPSERSPSTTWSFIPVLKTQGQVEETLQGCGGLRESVWINRQEPGDDQIRGQSHHCAPAEGYPASLTSLTSLTFLTSLTSLTFLTFLTHSTGIWVKSALLYWV